MPTAALEQLGERRSPAVKHGVLKGIGGNKKI